MMVEVEGVAGSDIVQSGTMEEIAAEITAAKTAKKLPVFWCETCCMKLSTPTQAISHFNGKSHKSKVNQMEQETRKRALPGSGGNVSGSEDNGPSKKKKSKSEPEESETCKDCDILLISAHMADQHYKGKKHLSTVAKKEAAKNLPPDTVPVPEALAKSHFCECCQVLLNSEEQVQQHVNGKPHKVKAGIIVKPPPPPPRAPSNPTRGGGVGRGFSTERGRGGRGFSTERGRGGRGFSTERGRGGRGFSTERGRGGRGWTSTQYRGGGRGWVKATGENNLNPDNSSGPGTYNSSSRSRGRGVNQGRGMENATRGRGADSSRGSDSYSRGRGNGAPGRGHDGAYRGFQTRGGGSGGRGYSSNRGSLSGYGNNTGWESGNFATDYGYSSYTSDSSAQEKPLSGYQYNDNGSNTPQQNYTNKTTSDAKPMTVNSSTSYSSNGYSTGEYYEQNQNYSSHGSNGQLYPHSSTANTESYYSNEYNKDTTNYNYGSYEQKQPQYQNTDATYDAYYA